MKKLPIGIQAIEEIIEKGYVYVDKTALISQLINEGKYYFLSRPRRFGKSLLLSTLKAIFNGKKELFKDCQIYHTQYKWQKCPILHFDFSQTPTDSSQNLETALKETLEYVAESYGVSLRGSSLQLQLGSLIRELSKDNQVVVLVDEYDKPLIDNLQRPEIVDSNRDLLRNFFGTLKGLDDHLKFVFVTGVTKFSQVSLFSGFNNLNDITLSPDYATLLGYTESEIHHFFQDRVQKLVAKKSHSAEKSKEELLSDMKKWYNGYRFSWGMPAVYNPYSTLNFLQTGRVQNYWFRTGTPSFLIKQIQEWPQSVIPLSGIMATEDELLNIHTPTLINLKALMWQTGYLTIQDYNPTNHLYRLDFPNLEVRKAFFNSLIQDFAKIESSSVNFIGLDCQKNLEDQNLKDFFKIINVFFAKIPYSLFANRDEATYHALFLVLLEGMGIRARAEEQTNIGRIDLIVEIEKIIYIFEFKLDKSAEDALSQIAIKNYKEKYLNNYQLIIAVGVNFSSKTHNVSDWKAIPSSTEDLL